MKFGNSEMAFIYYICELKPLTDKEVGRNQGINSKDNHPVQAAENGTYLITLIET